MHSPPTASLTHHAWALWASTQRNRTLRHEARKFPVLVLGSPELWPTACAGEASWLCYLLAAEPGKAPPLCLWVPAFPLSNVNTHLLGGLEELKEVMHGVADASQAGPRALPREPQRYPLEKALPIPAFHFHGTFPGDGGLPVLGPLGMHLCWQRPGHPDLKTQPIAAQMRCIPLSRHEPQANQSQLHPPFKIRVTSPLPSCP